MLHVLDNVRKDLTCIMPLLFRRAVRVTDKRLYYQQRQHREGGG